MRSHAVAYILNPYTIRKKYGRCSTSSALVPLSMFNLHHKFIAPCVAPYFEKREKEKMSSQRETVRRPKGGGLHYCLRYLGRYCNIGGFSCLSVSSPIDLSACEDVYICAYTCIRGSASPSLPQERPPTTVRKSIYRILHRASYVENGS